MNSPQDISAASRSSAADRRQFLTATAAATATYAGVHTSTASAETKSAADTVRIGLVGAGGRGGGAIRDSLSINENVKLVAIADIDDAKPARLRTGLTKDFESKVAVPDDKMYAGLDAYKRILDDSEVDVVLFATPPGFRPMHIREAVDAGKNVFAEKPTCVDATGYRTCLAADKKASENGTAIVTGTQYRRQTNYIEAVSKIHDGAIGDVIGGTSRYCTTGIWYKPRREGMTDTEYQIYNWMHFIWLSGDQISEQSVHNIDLMNWIMQGPPELAYGSGGRFARPADSEMWDSMSVDYQYSGNRFISFKNRQIANTEGENGTTIHGTEGSVTILGGNSGAFLYDRDGNETWSMKGDIGAAYKQEHKDLVDSIRSGSPIVELRETADSSMTAAMGRMSAYAGQTVTWDFATNKSELDLFQEPIDMSASRESSFAIPGRSKLV